MMTITDKIIVYQGLSTLNVLIIGFSIFTIFEAFIGYVRSYIVTIASMRITIELSSRIYEHLMKRSISYFDNHQTGEILTRIGEVHQIKDFLTGAPITAIIDLLFVIIFIFVILYISPILSLISIAVIPIQIGIVWLSNKIREQFMQEEFFYSMKNQASLTESISSIHTLKSMSVENSMMDLWRQQINNGGIASFKLFKVNNLSSLFSNLLNRLTNILVLYFGTKSVIYGEMTLGTFLAFKSLSSHVTDPLLNFADLWRQIQQVNLSCSRLSEIFEPELDQTNKGHVIHEINGGIEMKQVSFKYNSDMVIKNINLSIESGEIIGIIGRSGSGKTTLTKLLTGLYLPSKGEILLDGVDLSTMNKEHFRKNISIVMQENFLFSRTIKENILIAKPGASMDEVVKVAKLAGAHDLFCQ
jgi:subfamily B ATP-binding cassette protein HlyB/CyaB